jgi:cytochrome c-type biogenesis protein CcmE
MSMSKNTKMIIAVGAVLLVIGLLFAQGFKASGAMGVYLTIEEALAERQTKADRFIQMEGKVVATSIRYDNTKPTLVFDLTDDKKNIINVTFNDIKPDNFDSGYPVIVEGRFTGESKFVADKLKVKCPSKYEEEAKKK